MGYALIGDYDAHRERGPLRIYYPADGKSCKRIFQTDFEMFVSDNVAIPGTFGRVKREEMSVPVNHSDSRSER